MRSKCIYFTSGRKFVNLSKLF